MQRVVLLVASLSAARSVLSQQAIWSVVPAPLLSLGGAQGEGPSEFGKIAGVVRLRSGTLVVAEALTGQLRFFDARGSHLRTVGRLGRGPGEYTDIDRLFLAGDTLIVQSGSRTAHFHRLDGTYVRAARFPVSDDMFTGMGVGALASGALLLQRRAREQRPPSNVASDDSLYLVRWDRDGATVPLIRYPIAEVTNERGAPYTPVGFSPWGYFAVFGDRWCAGYSKSYDIRCYDADGALQWRINRNAPRRRVTSAEREGYRRAASGMRPDGTNRYTGSLREHRRATAARTRFPVTHPVHGEMLASENGELWVAEYRTEVAIARQLGSPPPVALGWDVLDQNGKPLATVTLPARFRPLGAGVDCVLGVSYDGDDLPCVQLLRLRR